ncbi:ATP-dependent DNA helicase RecG [Candidatus Njordibacter sp. Uisw_039]|uniref:ATP-dependent DNA helicase RecG n=1 Tax=Candidatus Njordibacter sp. Uisw_039 TaxID=3230972 RepID=UPI003D371AAA
MEVTQLNGVGPAVAAKLGKLGLHTVEDLLFHLPTRYQDRTRLVPLNALSPKSACLVEGQITSSSLQRGRRVSLRVNISQNGANLGLRFVHFHANQTKSFTNGRNIRCFGEIRPGPQGLEMVHPEYVLFDDVPPALADQLTPIYPTTEGLSLTRMGQLIAMAWHQLEQGSLILNELLPHQLISRYQLPSLVASLKQLHYPHLNQDLNQLQDQVTPAKLRLVLEELIAHQLTLSRAKQRNQRLPAPVLAVKRGLEQALIKNLPFQLTKAQQRVWQEVASDLETPTPMVRMVQGDVGSGKTVLAALGACRAIDNGCQVAVLAPTEILAEQHLNSFRHWLEPLGVVVTFLIGKQKTQTKRQSLAAITSGEGQIVIGTHALFQEAVHYQHLGLVIIDEQHRFGVAQRHSLIKKAPHGSGLHQLVMTATPIPRTLAMSAYGDLDHSVIDELPPGRKPINSVLINNNKRADVIKRIHQACNSGQQVYWICPLIETSDVLQCEAAQDTATLLTLQLDNINVGLVHGRLTSVEKADVMNRFKAGEIQLLVATTVVEVGVDVPNANLMVIDNAERLGLAQLHQLRGRVGRGQTQSHCLFMYQAPLSTMGRQRLDILRQSNDGFVIAEKDLQLRGPGEVLGTRQAGTIGLRIADLMRDAHLLPEVKRIAAGYAAYPDKTSQIILRWVGDRKAFAKV